MVYPPTTVDMHGCRRRAHRLVADRAHTYTLFVRFLAVGAIASTGTGGGHVGSFTQAIHRNAGCVGVAAGRASGAMAASLAAALVVAVVVARGRAGLALPPLAPAGLHGHRRAVGHSCGCWRDGLPLAA